MNRIFKINGILIEEFPSKENKTFQMVNFYQNGEYINYDNTYISLTRLSYTGTAQEIAAGIFPGQKVSSTFPNITVEISGITIIENFQFSTDRISRGRAINNFNERSDFYSFNLPTFDIAGASKIGTGFTGQSNVYIVDTLSSITFGVVFTATNNSDLFFTNNNGITFDLYQRQSPTPYTIQDPNNIFSILGGVSNPYFGPNIVSTTGYYTLSNLNNYYSGFSSVTITYDLSAIEGEFIIKGLFKWTNFTYFSKLAGIEYYEPTTYGFLPYSMYDPERDFYFIYLKRAEKPTLFNNTVTTDTLPLNVVSISPSYNGQTTFPLPNLNNNTVSSIMVTVNGLVLSTSEYSYSANTGILYINSGTMLVSDIITIVSSNDINASTIQVESYEVYSIPSTTYPSGNEKVIYNTNYNKYEYWLNYEVTNQPVLSINGQVLSNDIDFYVSSSNRRRLIFEGNIMVGDQITVFYNSVMNNGNNITTNIYPLNWFINTVPNNDLGFFLVEVTNDGDYGFNSPVYSAYTIYQVGQSTYGLNLPFNSGYYGQKFLVRVSNYKIFYTVLNQLVQSIEISDSIILTIKTNALNNY